jgi:hypothetical protein
MTASDCYRSAGHPVRAEQHRARAIAIVNGLIASFAQDQPLRESLVTSHPFGCFSDRDEPAERHPQPKIANTEECE